MIFVNLCRDILSSAPDMAVWEMMRLPRRVYPERRGDSSPSLRSGSEYQEGSVSGLMLPSLLLEDVIKDYYLIPTLKQFLNWR